MSEKASEEAIVNHLEETYGEKFEVETFKEGHSIFKNMYGDDKVIVHPEGKPEQVFLAGTKRDHEDKYYDTYMLSKWGEELTGKYKQEIQAIVPGDYDYRVLLYVEDGKYDSSMKSMSAMDYFSKKNQDAEVVLKVAVKTSEAPNPEEYYEPVYRLLQLLEPLGVEAYGVSLGFVDDSVDAADYIRTSNVNNVPWSNLDAKVFGTIMVDNLAKITEPGQIEAYYEPFEE